MIQSDQSSEIYNGNNSTTVPYPIPFYFIHDEDLVVNSINTLGTATLLQLNTDYIVTGAGNQNGGSLKTTFELPIDWKLLIERVIEATQLTSYQEGDSFPAKSHEQALDKLTMLVQQALRQSGGGSGAGGGGRAWADDSERTLTTPNFTGQLGFQVNTATIYYAQSMTTGDWEKAIFDNTSAATGSVAVFSTHSHLTTQVLDGIATLIGGVLGAIAKPAGDLVGTTEPQTLTNKTLESPVIHTPTGIKPVDVGLGNVDNVSDANKPISNATAVALAEKEDKINKGQLGGYAPLDQTGKIPLQQMPESVLGANVYQGTWNAATNIPTIPPASLANQGWYWVVSVAGSTNIDGTSTWAPGDWIISNGTIWQRIANIDSVSSVNAKTGAVVINKADVGLSNVDNTSDTTKNSAVATLTNKTLTTPVINSPTGLVKADVGLSAVDNTSDAQKNIATATLTNKTIDGANNTLRVRLDTTDVVNNLPVSHLDGGSGADTGTFWRGDGHWGAPAGGGDVTGPAGAIAGELATYADGTGKLLGRAPNIYFARLRSFNAVGNANFEVDQRNAGGNLVATGLGAWATDRWYQQNVGTARVSCQQIPTNVVLPGTNFYVTSKIFRTTLTTQQASLGANDYVTLLQTVEGSKLRELYGDVHSLQLLVRSSVASLKFSVALVDVNGTATRSLVKLCTMGAANTWALITLPNLPVWAAGGAWNVNFGATGYVLHVQLAAGTSLTAPAADVWQTGNYKGAPGMDNFASKPVNSTFDMAFVQHEPGSVCSTLMDCPFQESLNSCLRYYEKSYPYAVLPGIANSAGHAQFYVLGTGGHPLAPIRFAQMKATVPAVIAYSPFNGQINTCYDYSVGNVATTAAVGVAQGGFSGFTVSTPASAMWGFHWVTDTGM